MSYKFQPSWPRIDRYPDAIDNLGGDTLGYDAEWDIRTGVPSILGLSDGNTTVSVPHDEGLPHLKQLIARRPNASWIGHNFIGAEFPLMKRQGAEIRLEQVEDTIIWHWLVNMHLCKAQKKATDDDGEKRGRGFMNIWSMCSIYTNLPCWKKHRGPVCGVCPSCDPFIYNGLDTLAPIVALAGLKQQARLRGVDHLYPLHRDLAWKLHQMSERGVLVNREYVENDLRLGFEADKRALYDKEASKKEKRAIGALPFNPDSPKQVIEFFRAKGITLSDTSEDTIREATDDNDDPDLSNLLDWKELGDGPDRWFMARTFDYKRGNWDGYVDDDGYIHCKLGYYTSSGRLNCVDPNLQNVPKRRVDRTTGEPVGKKMRRAIVAPEGYNLFRADYSNAENRVVLHQAGYTIAPDLDLHTWVAEIAQLDPASDFCIRLGGPREAAKSIQHAGNILEGLDLKTDADLKKARTLGDIRAGALLVFSDWRFEGQTVCFNGINLADRVFGDHSQANRKRALEIQQRYFDRFPKLRDFQRRYLKQVEREGAVRTPLGYTTLSYGFAKDRAKQAAAIMQSQPVAHATKMALLRDDPRIIDALQVHDEILMYVDARHDPRKVKGWIQEKMDVEMDGLKGLRLPVDVSYGAREKSPNQTSNWADQVKL